LVFTAAALDPHLRAFDADTGKELWTVELPASAQSTPMTYEWQGKQYLVVCAGGHEKMKSKMGDTVVAFRSGLEQTHVGQDAFIRVGPWSNFTGCPTNPLPRSFPSPES